MHTQKLDRVDDSDADVSGRHDLFFHCTDSRGERIRIGKGVVDNGSIVSTSYYSEERKVSLTQIAVIMERLGPLPFCACFLKKVNHTQVADGLEGQDISTKAKRRKVLKELMEGEERVMHARLDRSGEDDVQMELGRYRVIDLEVAPPANAQRLVDTRTIKWLICDGTKYYV